MSTRLAAPGPAVATSAHRASPGQMARYRFRKNRLALAGAVLLVAVLVCVALLPLVLGTDPNGIDLRSVRQPPSGAHLLGTDATGRDVFARLLAGGRVSLGIGVTAAAGALLLGIALGVAAGMVGDRVDSVIMRAADITLSFPSLIVVIVVVGILGPSVATLIVAIALFEWPTTCRLVRGELLALREQEFVQAARVVGVSDARLVLRHYIPALLMPLSVVATLLIAHTILLEAALSFLGLGVQPPQASWGNMLNDAQSLTALESMPWLWVPPGVAIILTVLSVNFIGDGLRDALDTRG